MAASKAQAARFIPVQPTAYSSAPEDVGLTRERIFGWAFSPLAWLLGVPWSDASEIGSLLGVKMVANEFVAFQQLSEMLGGSGQLHTRSVIIATYALCGFANFGSIGIQLGGIGGIAVGFAPIASMGFM